MKKPPKSRLLGLQIIRDNQVVYGDKVNNGSSLCLIPGLTAGDNSIDTGSYLILD